MTSPPHVDARFVLTPFMPALTPALGASLLVAHLRRAGIAADVRYLHLPLWERMGHTHFDLAAGGFRTDHLTGEALFARALWGAAAPPWAAYEARLREELERFPETSRTRFYNAAGGSLPGFEDMSWASFLEAARGLFEEAPAMVETWADEVLAGDPRIVGLSMVFSQTVASLALARALRRRRGSDRLTILLGGPNCEDEMGRALAESFPEVDAVVSGEADGVIVDLVRACLAGRGPGRRFIAAPPVEDLDALPEPVFDDFVAAIRGTPLEDKAMLSAETSRGCWWGSVSPCTFCGLNGTTMRHRSKSAGRAAEEIRSLRRRYGIRVVSMADCMMPLPFVETLFPLLREDRIALIYETKSNLRKEQLRALGEGGCRIIQPGIESLSDEVLRLMRKGVTRLQNVRTLKGAADLGMAVLWNFIFGFPGETPEAYAEMARTVPLLHHLTPPVGATPLRLDRFSPLWRDAEAMGLRRVRPSWGHDFAFAGLDEAARARLAYFFDFEYADGRDTAAYVGPLLEALDAWYAARASGARLEYAVEEGVETVLDSRTLWIPTVTPVSPPEKALLLRIDRPATREEVRAEGGEEAAAALDRFAERGWVLEDRGRFFSLVVDPAERLPRLWDGVPAGAGA